MEQMPTWAKVLLAGQIISIVMSTAAIAMNSKLAEAIKELADSIVDLVKRV